MPFSCEMNKFGFISFEQFACNNNTKPAWFAAVLPVVVVKWVVLTDICKQNQPGKGNYTPHVQLILNAVDPIRLLER